MQAPSASVPLHVVRLSVAAIPLVLSAVTLGAQHLVVPASHAGADGGDRFFVAGTAEPRRQLTLIDQSELTAMLGRPVIAISWRRNAENDDFPAGRANLTLHLSHARTTWATASEFFAANVGPDRTEVFHGTVDIPYSPAANANPAAWRADQTLHVALTTPFLYLGGTLALEVSGAPDASMPIEWWPADAVWHHGDGQVIDVGAGCGPFGPNAAGLSPHNLIPGGTAQFTAVGAPGEFAYLAIANAALPRQVDLAAFGAPGCWLHLLSPLDGVATAVSQALQPSQPNPFGLAACDLQLPNAPQFLGASFGAQWVLIGGNGITASNGLGFTIGSQRPSLPITLVTAPELNGQPPAKGLVFPARGHVLRFEFL